MSELYVLDFDRTLADTDDMFDKLCEAAEQVDPALKQKLIKYNEERLSQGDERPMFHPGSVFGDQKAEVYKAFVQNTSEEEREYIYEDAKRLLNKVKKLGKMAVVLTFGDPEWQEAKVKATLGVEEFDLPVVYTEKKIKSKTIDSWREKDDTYKIGSYKADQVVGVGDEISDFIDYDNLPNARGYLVDPHDKKKDQLPNNVEKIKSLDEVVLSE